MWCGRGTRGLIYLLFFFFPFLFYFLFFDEKVGFFLWLFELQHSKVWFTCYV